MHVTSENEQDLMSMADERKWKLVRGEVSGRYFGDCPLDRPLELLFICAKGFRLSHEQMQRRVQLPPDFFADQLRRHLDPELKSGFCAKFIRLLCCIPVAAMKIAD